MTTELQSMKHMIISVHCRVGGFKWLPNSHRHCHHPHQVGQEHPRGHMTNIVDVIITINSTLHHGYTFWDISFEAYLGFKNIVFFPILFSHLWLFLSPAPLQQPCITFQIDLCSLGGFPQSPSDSLLKIEYSLEQFS